MLCNTAPADEKRFPEVLEQTADVDWLTVTAKAPEPRTRLFGAATKTMADLKGAGFVVKNWKFKGYNGWSCGSFRWGGRDDSDIVMMSGQMARDNFRDVLLLAGNVTRIDLALTVHLAQPLIDLAWDAYNDLKLNVADGACKKRKLTFVSNNDGGQTLYVGSRMSDQFGRLYDKGCESGAVADELMQIGELWRYEVEFKGYRAKRIAAQITQHLIEEEDIHGSIGATVHKWFLSRRVPVISAAYTALPYIAEITATITDDELTLNWLSTQVKPSISRLISSGKLGHTLQALGLEYLDIPAN